MMIKLPAFGQPPKRLIVELARQENIQTFIETGTYRGNTAYWAAMFFKQVITIEACPDLYYQLTWFPQNVRFILGNSAEMLGKVRPAMPCIFWLDAHFVLSIEGNLEIPTIPGYPECPYFRGSGTSPDPHPLLRIALCGGLRCFLGGEYRRVGVPGGPPILR